MKKFFITGMLSTLLIGCGAESIDVSKVPERGFYSTRAASKWEESLVTGNGTMGIMVEGNPYRSRSCSITHYFICHCISR